MNTPWLPDEPSLRCFPPHTSGSLFRSPSQLQAVVAQFDVEHHPRYRSREGKTFCSTFAWDVSRAMGCELPKDYGLTETVTRVDSTAPRDVVVKHERTINELIDWLHSGASINVGWRLCNEATAVAAAAAGKLALVLWKNPKGPTGHVAVVMPTPAGETGTRIAQAGAKCFSFGPLHDGFPAILPLEFSCHD